MTLAPIPVRGRLSDRGAASFACAATCFLLLASGCASAPKSEAASAAGGGGEGTAAEQWAERRAAAEAGRVKRAPRASSDPLGMNGELEESAIPKTEITPKGQLLAKSPGELNAAMNDVKTSSSVEGAVKRL